MKTKPISEEQCKRLKNLSTFLRELRFNENMTQKEVCHEINLHRNTLVRIENSHNFNIISLFELADFYDIPINQIFLDFE
jgi:transcriptional regulator with XRE-family HTH domain